MQIHINTIISVNTNVKLQANRAAHTGGNTHVNTQLNRNVTILAKHGVNIDAPLA